MTINSRPGMGQNCGSISSCSAVRTKHYSLSCALAQNYVIAKLLSLQGIDTRRSRLDCLRGFEPNGSAIFGDLEDVKTLRHNNWGRGRVLSH